MRRSPFRPPVTVGAMLLVVAVVLGLAGAAVAVSAAFAGGGGGRVGSNVVANPNGPDQLITARNSPTVVRNPARPGNVVVVDRVDRPGFSAELDSSMDGGRTWRHLVLPLPAGRDRPYAPDAAFSPDGTLYVSYLNLEGVGNDPQTLWLAHSGDGGTTLSAPARVADHLVFQPRLAVGADRTVYLTWLQGSEVGNLTLVGPPAPVVLARSSDGGTTFSAPVPVSDTSRTLVGAASPVIGRDGSLFVLYEDFKNDVRDFQNLDGPVWDSPFSLVVTRSSDGGRSFAPGVVVDSDVVPTARFLVYQPPFPSLAAGPGRSLYVAWSGGRSGAPEVWLRRSGDDGATWDPAVRVDGQGRQELPTVAVAPDGRVDVVCLEGAGGHRLVAELATSADRGASFTNLRLSSASFDSTVGPRTGPVYLGTDLGSRLGLSSTDSGVVTAWTDTRQGTQDTGRQDVETAGVTGLGGGGPAGRLALAGALVVAALLVPAIRWGLGHIRFVPAATG
jgi:hypothetical protein